MADARHRQLSRRERQIMDIIYARGEATAKQVLDDMSDPPTRTAVRTMLGILEDKGQLKHRKEGREFVYAPVRPRRRAGQHALKGVIQTFFDGSLEQAVAAHLTNPGTKLSDDELKELANLIKDARNRGQ